MKIPFEIHITTDTLNKEFEQNFIDICLQSESKPILIELSQGEFKHQPMLTKTVYEEKLESVLDWSNHLSNTLITRGFEVKRLKIEVPVFHTHLFKKHKSKHSNYFEWHGKIDFFNTSKLLELCEKHKVHLSRNALKNESNTRFITLREFGDKLHFEKRILDLSIDLKIGTWTIEKQQSEFCIYDNNTFLDTGWLPQ